MLVGWQTHLSSEEEDISPFSGMTWAQVGFIYLCVFT